VSHSRKNDADGRSRIRRTALLLGAVALLFYLGFILLGALRA
jgi:hypothetical protein